MSGIQSLGSSTSSIKSQKSTSEEAVTPRELPEDFDFTQFEGLSLDSRIVFGSVSNNNNDDDNQSENVSNASSESLTSKNVPQAVQEDAPSGGLGDTTYHEVPEEKKEEPRFKKFPPLSEIHTTIYDEMPEASSISEEE